ncbi:unnamed protein product [Closterium sp. Naga37s-1]|nr:unnamed protein product [Closterium sp. Naga37s-1]
MVAARLGNPPTPPTPKLQPVLGTLSLCSARFRLCSAMAGHGAGLSDDEGDADVDDADSIAIEEARTGLYLLLRSLGRQLPPPAPTAPGPVPTVAGNPNVPSSPDSIRSVPPAPPGVSDTVHIGTSASKSSVPRTIKLKQQKLSFWKPSSNVPVSEAVVNEATVRPSLDINVQEIVDAIFAEALDKYKTLEGCGITPSHLGRGSSSSLRCCSTRPLGDSATSHTGGRALDVSSGCVRDASAMASPAVATATVTSPAVASPTMASASATLSSASAVTASASLSSATASTASLSHDAGM